MEHRITLNAIAHIRSSFPEKFGIPRQGGLADTRGNIVFEPEYRDVQAFRGLEEYSHIWLVWEFSETLGRQWSPTVRPPRLGGNIRKGVFATRSPFRPNPIGLSCVRLEKVELELLDELDSTLQKYQASDLHQKLSLIFTDLFVCVQENAEMVQILLGENGDLNFVNQVKERVREKCLKDWFELFNSQDSQLFDAFNAFVVSGCLGLVTYWLQNGMKESPKELAQIAEQIMMHGIKILG